MKCDACGAPVENGVCTYCGKKFAVESSNSAESVPQGTVPQGHFDATPKKKKGMTTCRSCGAQIAASAKTCPYCGAKNKKPVYKRGWFIALVVLLLLGMIGSAGGSSEKDSAPAKTSNSSQPADTSSGYDAQRIYTESADAIYGVTSMEYALGKLDSSYESLLYGFVPNETLNNWDDTCQFVLDASKEYLESIDSLDAVFNSSEGDPTPIQVIVASALTASTDKDVKGYFPDGTGDFGELVKQLAKTKSYRYCSSDDLIAAVNDNPLKAKETYKDNFIFVKGKISNMDSNGKYIDITSMTDPYDFTIIQCYIKNDTVKNTVMDLKKGDTVIVGGIVSDVGELMGYSINMYLLQP